MSKVIKNNDGVGIVEGTPASSLIKEGEKFFASKPPERMAGESIFQPRKIDPRAINTRSPIPKKPQSENGKGMRSGRRVRQGFGNSCPDPNMLILMADGSQKKAGDLVVGDLLKTNHEKGFELGEYKVEYKNVVNDVQKIKLIFDKTEIICSFTHKFLVDKSWKEAKNMKINDEVSGKKLLSTEEVEDGDVVHITVEDAHTYICEGLLSHNKRFAPKPKKDESADEPRKPRESRSPRPDKEKGTDKPIKPKRNEAKDKAEARKKRFYQRRRSKKEARRSEKEQEATKGKFITTLGR